MERYVTILPRLLKRSPSPNTCPTPLQPLQRQPPVSFTFPRGFHSPYHLSFQELPPGTTTSSSLTVPQPLSRLQLCSCPMQSFAGKNGMELSLLEEQDPGSPVMREVFCFSISRMSIKTYTEKAINKTRFPCLKC